MLDDTVEAQIRHTEAQAVSDFFLSRLDHSSQIYIV